LPIFIRSGRDRVNADSVQRITPSGDEGYKLIGSAGVHLGDVYVDDLEMLDQLVPAHPSDHIVVLYLDARGEYPFHRSHVRTYELPVIAWRLTPGWVEPVCPGHCMLDGLDFVIPMRGKLFQASFADTDYHDWATILECYLDYRTGLHTLTAQQAEDLEREQQMPAEADVAATLQRLRERIRARDAEEELAAKKEAE